MEGGEVSKKLHETHRGHKIYFHPTHKRRQWSVQVPGTQRCAEKSTLAACRNLVDRQLDGGR